MADKRARTLQALSTFIEKQRALLTRTQADIGRLNELRSRAVAQSEEVEENLAEQLNDGAFRLSELEEAADSLPEGIEWSLFAKCDPSPLQALAAKPRQQPPPTTVSTISDFQQRIKEAKASILDPVFSTWNLSFKPVIETGDEEKDLPPLDSTALKKAKEREKIKELKKHKIMPTGLTLTPSGLRTRGPGGVFIRRDLVDESMYVDVDISLDSRSVEPATPSGLPSTFSDTRKPPDDAVTSAPPPAPPAPPLTMRQRRKSSRACPDDMDVDDSNLPPTPDSLPHAEPEPEPEPELDPDDSSEDDSPPKVLGKRGRPKSDTYKQAWSTSEQQLLEALLEEIPEGEKNRWKKISRAMNGRRTPRQVASRVQKYFEKLKKFGIE